jgi:hypothetical protein
MSDLLLIALAQRMWDAYSQQAGGKTFDGKPLPSWDELGEERQACWNAAASAALTSIPHTFGFALSVLECGGKVQRRGWNGKGLWLEMQRPDVHSKMTLPYIFMSYPADAINTPGARVPWLASQTDMLARDWVIVP